jgi:hypothetical protein
VRPSLHLKPHSKDKNTTLIKNVEADICIGDKVLLNSKNAKIRKPGTPKLMPKRMGPRKVIEKIIPVAYRLELPPNLRIHNVFHVFLMQK